MYRVCMLQKLIIVKAIEQRHDTIRVKYVCIGKSQKVMKTHECSGD